MERDRSGGKGDFETVPELADQFGGLCPDPADFQARRKSDGAPAGQTGQVLRANDGSKGLVCVNADQPAGGRCDDYEVRLCCGRIIFEFLERSSCQPGVIS